MQCIVKEVYSSLVVGVVWWDSPLMNIGDIGDTSFHSCDGDPPTHVVSMCVIVPFLMDVISGCIQFGTR